MVNKENYYEFPCGCRVLQYGDQIKDYDALPKLKIDYYNLPLTCESTWNLLGLGRTRGIFQLESNFGKGYSKKLQPENLEHLAALSAILRPGCSNAIVDGKSMTEHFVERRHGREEITYIDDRLEQYLKGTFGILVYQEQMIAMSGGLAGFDGKSRNSLRKAVGKKDVAKLYSLREQFINGCINNNLTKENSEAIFDNIESSGRYSFNKSHAIAYGLVSYWTAFVKVHFPIHFFCSSLKSIKDYDNLRDLMSEVSIFGIDIKNPSIDNLSERFTIRDGYIQYGFGEVKSVGSDAVKLINKVVEIEKVLGKPASEFTWYEFLVLVSQDVCKTAINNLIMCGFLDNTGVSRNRQLHEYNTLSELTKTKMKTVHLIYQNHNNLFDLLVALKGMVKSNEVEKMNSLLSSLENPGRSLDDSPKTLYKKETDLLGVAISADPIANKAKLANIKCADFLIGKGKSKLRFVTIVKSVVEKTVKTGVNAGKRYANIRLEDKTGEIECSIFTKQWMDLKPLVVAGNVILVNGSRGQDENLRIESVELI